MQAKLVVVPNPVFTGATRPKQLRCVHSARTRCRVSLTHERARLSAERGGRGRWRGRYILANNGPSFVAMLAKGEPELVELIRAEGEWKSSLANIQTWKSVSSAFAVCVFIEDDVRHPSRVHASRASRRAHQITTGNRAYRRRAPSHSSFRTRMRSAGSPRASTT
jgi:hypothetical protein